MQEATTAGNLTHSRWGVGVVGKTVDDRGTSATDFANQHCDVVIQVSYNPSTFSMEIGQNIVEAEDVYKAIETWGNVEILFEVTTLGFTELLLCTAAVKKLGLGKAQYLYVEPDDYRLSRRTPLLHRRDFDLSDDVPGYTAIPGYGVLLEKERHTRAVFFLGYEERRLDRAMEDFQLLRPANSSVVFGVPAFKAGWEMNAFANNVRVLRERDIRGGVSFCGAENPLGSFGVLTEVRQMMEAHDSLVVAPIGTKPNGLGVALFAIENPGTGILYDHPAKSSKRSERVANWHLYEVAF